MLSRLAMALSLGILGSLASNAGGDATFVYELADPDGTRTVKRIAVSGFWARVDDPAIQDRFLLFQAGKFFPVYEVDEGKKTYTLLTDPVTPRLSPQGRGTAASKKQAPETAATSVPDATPDRPVESTGEPIPPSPAGTSSDQRPAAHESASTRAVLKPTGKKRTVANVGCRVVRELVAGEPVAEHCMGNTAGFSVATRELITLGRTFEMAKKLGMDWLGVATDDERFVSVKTRQLGSPRALELKSVSSEPLPAGYHRISRDFSRVERSTRIRSN